LDPERELQTLPWGGERAAQNPERAAQNPERATMNEKVENQRKTALWTRLSTDGSGGIKTGLMIAKEGGEATYI